MNKIRQYILEGGKGRIARTMALTFADDTVRAAIKHTRNPELKNRLKQKLRKIRKAQKQKGLI